MHILLTTFLLIQPQAPTGPEVLTRMAAALKGVKSVRAVYEEKKDGTAYRSIRILLLRPSFYRASDHSFEMVQDAKGFTYYDKSKNEFERGRGSDAMIPPGIYGFEELVAPIFKMDFRPEVTLANVDGSDLLKVATGPTGSKSRSLYVDPKTYLPAGYLWITKTATYEGLYRNLDINIATTERDYDWTPPKGAREIVPPEVDSKLLKNGATVPEFTLADLDGRKLSLSARTKGAKAVIVSFWFIGCAPCMQERHHLIRFQKELADQGLKIFWINTQDSAEAVKKFLKDYPVPFDVLIAKDARKSVQDPYGVLACPTTYVLSSKLQVVGSMVGYQPATLDNLVKDALD